MLTHKIPAKLRPQAKVKLATLKRFVDDKLFPGDVTSESVLRSGIKMLLLQADSPDNVASNSKGAGHTTGTGEPSAKRRKIDRAEEHPEQREEVVDTVDTLVDIRLALRRIERKTDENERSIAEIKSAVREVQLCTADTNSNNDRVVVSASHSRCRT